MKTTKLPTSKAKTAYGLLSEVRKLILAEPLRYNQHWWLTKRIGGWVGVTELPACGTVACVAGWVRTLKAPTARRGVYGTKGIAANVLGLDEGQCTELFFSEAAGDGQQTIAHAKRGAAHIRRFQKRYAKHLKATAV